MLLLHLIILFTPGLLGAVTRLSCILPAFPANGRYSLQGNDLVPGDEVSKPTVLHYSCSPDFILNYELSVCQGNDVWTPIPTCTKPCKLFTSYTVDYTCYSPENLVMPCQPSMPHGSYVLFECKTGHTLSGTQTLDEMRCNHGFWSISLPECKADCGLEVADGATFIFNAPVAKLDTLPWQVAVYERQPEITFICGGTILSTKIVISAAHCFYGTDLKRAEPAEQFLVAAHKHFQSWDHPNETNVPKSEIAEIRLHQWYTGDLHHHQNDVALLVLKTPFEFSNTVGAICYDFVNQRFDDYQLSPSPTITAKFAGWGGTEEQESSQELRVLNVPFIGQRECIDEFVKYKSQRYITADKICAGYTNGSTGCNGDSGAGLVFPQPQGGEVRWWLRGILSIGPRNGFTCRNDTYTAFTRVFALRDWINPQINEILAQREIYKVPEPLAPPKTEKSSNCILPSYPAHGKFNVSGPNRNLLPGATVDEFTLITYYCDNNYDPSIQNVRAVCNEGKWDSPPPVCRKTCRMVRSRTVDFRCYKSGIEMDCPQFLPYGSVITPTCKSGHQNPSDDLENLTCSQGGDWDKPIPDCTTDCGLEKPFGVELIVNGLRGKKDTFPWHVGIFQKDETTNSIQYNICGGSIISANLVISVAHCFFDPDNRTQRDARYYKVAAGKFLRSWDNDLPENTKLIQKSDVKRIYLPPSYGGDALNQQHDIALLQLATPFKLTNSVRAVCYDIINERFDALQTEPGKIGKVAGWGRTETGEPSEELKTLDLPVIGLGECRIEMSKYNFNRYLTTDKMCAGHLDENAWYPWSRVKRWMHGMDGQAEKCCCRGRALCQGDTGGGLVFPAQDTEGNTRWYLRGVVSIGPANDDRTSCRADTYTAFTHIFKVRDWLKETIRSVTMLMRPQSIPPRLRQRQLLINMGVIPLSRVQHLDAYKAS